MSRRLWHNWRRSWTQILESKPLLRRSIYSLYWLPMAIVFTQYGYTVKQVQGRSMQPTLNPDTSRWQDIILFDRYHARVVAQYERGDIVAVWSISNPRRLLLKRIIALEGDIVQTLPPYPDSEVCIPQGHAWIEGDEPFRSEDSNKMGPVPLGLIDSKLAFIIWPLDRMGPISHIVPSDTKGRNLKGGPAWRHEMAEVERQRWRSSRVKIAGSS